MRQIAVLAAAAALSATAATGSAQAAGEEVRSFTASRIQVARACVTYHGVGLMTPGRTGQYGCYTRSGWVQCEQDKSCSGSRYDHFKDVSARFAHAHGVEGVLAGRTTRLVPRHDR